MLELFRTLFFIIFLVTNIPFYAVMPKAKTPLDAMFYVPKVAKTVKTTSRESITSTTKPQEISTIPKEKEKEALANGYVWEKVGPGPIPYETKIIESSNMFAGERKVVQAGQTGLRMTNILIKRDSQGNPVDTLERYVVILQDPVDEIIHIGTKPSEEYMNPPTETREEFVTEGIPFSIESYTDSTLPQGQERVDQEGSNGEKVILYKITYSEGIEIEREVISSQIVKEPVVRIVAIGVGQSSEEGGIYEEPETTNGY